MKKITYNTSRKELAAIITKKLLEKNITAVLVGGAVVSIYTNNEYQSKDLDFISEDDHKNISLAMKEIGFTPKGKDFYHPHTKFSVEFPTGPIAIGDQSPIIPEGHIEVDGIIIKLLSPTQCVMDRLCWFYFNNDRQCLDQAVLVAKSQTIDINKIKKWSQKENENEKFETFLDYLKSK